MMLVVSHLSKHFGAKRAVDDISFSIAPGEIVGFLGPNGAGKSTTMNMLTGYISSTDGKICINGIDLLQSPKEAKKHIGYLPEIPPLYLDMTVEEYLSFVYELKKVTLPKRKHLNEILALTSLTNVRGRLLRNLSKGYRQRAGLAQALIGDPDVLILDEPTIGLDPTQIIEFRNIIVGLNKTVIFSTHILSEVSAICSRILIINQGKIIAEKDCSTMGKEDFQYTVQFSSAASRSMEVLQKIEGIKDIHVISETASCSELSLNCTRDIRPEMFRALAAADIPILLLKDTVHSLEEIFLETVSGAQKEVTA
ncbi:MAG: ATP-binding cassette domain-containing protein [Clostridia bacterium]|nr:ATP-binding cassette domain-containing protein [Clostridia bacterium]